MNAGGLESRARKITAKQMTKGSLQEI